MNIDDLVVDTAKQLEENNLEGIMAQFLTSNTGEINTLIKGASINAVFNNSSDGLSVLRYLSIDDINTLMQTEELSGMHPYEDAFEIGAFALSLLMPRIIDAVCTEKVEKMIESLNEGIDDGGLDFNPNGSFPFKTWELVDTCDADLMESWINSDLIMDAEHNNMNDAKKLRSALQFRIEQQPARNNNGQELTIEALLEDNIPLNEFG